jgi:hypothetical protein
MMDQKIDRGSYRDSVRHHAAKSNTLGNSPILRIIVTGIGNLQTCYRCLDVRMGSSPIGAMVSSRAMPDERCLERPSWPSLCASEAEEHLVSLRGQSECHFLTTAGDRGRSWRARRRPELPVAVTKRNPVPFCSVPSRIGSKLAVSPPPDLWKTLNSCGKSMASRRGFEPLLPP